MRAGKIFFLVGFLLAATAPVSAQTASNNLGPGDLGGAGGLRLVHFGEGTDGESDVLVCGSDEDLRGARRVRGGTDGDVADRFLHFNIDPALRPTVKSAVAVTVRAVVHDAPELAGSSVELHYTTNRSRGSGDLDETFFLHPFVHSLEGSDSWVTLQWRIRDAGFTTLQNGVGDFRIGATSPVPGGGTGIARPCVDFVSVSVGVPALSCPTALSVSVDDDTGVVTVGWMNTGIYRRIRVLRNGRPAAVLPGTVDHFSETPGPGRFTYEVVALPDGDACAVERLRGEAWVFPKVGACGCPNPDASGDRDIDLQDLAIVASNLGLKEGDPAFTPAADVDRSGAVDMLDVELVLAHQGGLPPVASPERVLPVSQTFTGVSEAGPLIRITSPFSRGSGQPDADAASLLSHGRVLVVSDSGPAGAIYELNPATGTAVAFPAAGMTDSAGDAALARPTGVAFAGPRVWVSNRALVRGGRNVGSVAALDRRTASPLAGPTGTGVFAGNEDAVDVAGSPGVLEETGGISPGGSGPDGTPGGDNELHFQSNSRSGLGDTTDRSASLTAVDFDTGLHKVASLGAKDGIPGPLTFRETAAASSLVAAAAVRIEAETGELRGPGLALGAGGSRIVTSGAGESAHVLFTIADLPGEAAPGANTVCEFVVRVSALFPEGTEFGSVRLEALETESAIERRLRRGNLPGKLGSSLRTVPLGRLKLRAGAGGNNLILRFGEPGVEIDALEFEGPVGGGRLYAATRDPGAVRVYALAATGNLGTPGTLLRGVLERVIGTCPIEGGPGSDFLIAPVALELTGTPSAPSLLVLDAARSTLGRIPLDDASLEAALPECYRIPLGEQLLTGLASGPVGADGLPGFYLAARARPGGAAGGAGGGGDLDRPGAGQGGGETPIGVHAALGLHGIFFDREASDIVRALGLLNFRTLVVKGSFSDGTVRDVTLRSTILSLDPDVAAMETSSRLRAVASAGVARLRAEYEGRVAETEVCVSPAGRPWRSYVPAKHLVRPIPPPEENGGELPSATARIFPDRESYEELYGVAVEVLRFPLGHRQQFSALIFDRQGRAIGIDPDWSVESEAGNSVDSSGLFTGVAVETGEIGFGGEVEGLAIEAEIAGRSDREPLAVYAPGKPLLALPEALRILPRGLRVAPGSRVRFVALLVDAEGFPRNFSPEWSSDGLPIDAAAGILDVQYRAETADETFHVVCRDPISGLADIVEVTVAYGETSGIGPIPDAHTVTLAQSFFDGALKDVIVAAGTQLDGFLDVKESNSGRKQVKDQVGDDVSFLLGKFRCFFSVEFLAEFFLGLDQVKEIRLDHDEENLVVTLRLRVRELLSAKIEQYRVIIETAILPLIRIILGMEDPKTQPSPAADKVDVVKDSLSKIENSIAEVTVRMDLATGEFSDLEEGTWKTENDVEVSLYLARQFIAISGVQEGLEQLRGLIKKTITDLLVDPDGGVLRIPIELFCELLGNIVNSILGPVAGEVVKAACKEALVELVQKLVSDAVDLLFDTLSNLLDIEGRLHKALEDQVVQPILEFLVRVLRQQDMLKHARVGHEVWTLVDDLARSGQVRFGGFEPDGASFSIDSSTLPGELIAFQGVDGITISDGGINFTTIPYAAFRHAGLISYSEESGLVLEALAAATTPTGVPFDPTNGLAPGQADLGVSTRAADILTSLFRFGGTTAYRTPATPVTPATPRGAVKLGSAVASAGGRTVTIEVFSVSAPRLELTGGAAGASVGSAHVLLQARVTGDLRYVVTGEAVAQLAISRAGRTVTMDVATGAPEIRSPTAGEMPFAVEIRALFVSSVPNLRTLITGTLGGRLPITVEYPDRVSVEGLGRLVTSLTGGDTDADFQDDFLKATFQVDLGAGGELSAQFLRGDCNGEGRVDISDAVAILNALFQGGSRGDCWSACDSDASGAVDITDAVYLLRWMGGATPPPSPFPRCGWDRGAFDCTGGGHGCR